MGCLALTGSKNYRIMINLLSFSISTRSGIFVAVEVLRFYASLADDLTKWLSGRPGPYDDFESMPYAIRRGLFDTDYLHGPSGSCGAGDC
ncbi:hypothetical protein MY5147_009082 [Beauveria neobassiana]